MGSVPNSPRKPPSATNFGYEFFWFHDLYVSHGDPLSQDIFVSCGDPHFFRMCDKSNMSETYQSRLRKIREEKNIKQADAAEVAGVQRPYLSDFENGKKLGSLSMVLNLTKFYDISLDYVFGRSTLSHIQSPESIAHNEKERILLEIWRRLNEEEKTGLMLLLQGKASGSSAA